MHEVRYKIRKPQQVTQEKSKDAVLFCRDGANKAKANVKLNLVKNTQKKGFYKFQTANVIKIIEKTGGQQTMTIILF